MKAIVVGATGAVGSDLLKQLTEDPLYEQVIVFVRRTPEIQHEKLIVHLIDFEKTETWQDKVCGDVLFSCLGTTLKQAGSKEAQWRVDHDYQLEFAKIAEKNGVSQYILVSSIWASSSSKTFYTKMKGVLEDEVRVLSFKHIAILQPPSLIRKNSDRMGETAAVKILSGLNRIGLLKSMKPMDTEIVARAMRVLASSGHTGCEVIVNQQIAEIAELPM